MGEAVQAEACLFWGGVGPAVVQLHALASAYRPALNLQNICSRCSSLSRACLVRLWLVAMTLGRGSGTEERRESRRGIRARLTACTRRWIRRSMVSRATICWRSSARAASVMTWAVSLAAAGYAWRSQVVCSGPQECVWPVGCRSQLPPGFFLSPSSYSAPCAGTSFSSLALPWLLLPLACIYYVFVAVIIFVPLS